MSELRIGSQVLGRYRVVSPLGRGGMGVVYLGRTEGAAGFTRPVVIKRLHTDLSGDRPNEMFAREARILANLQHPNIVNVVDFGREGSSYVMVLEYVHGYDLDQWLQLLAREARQLNHEYALYIIRRILAALQQAHDVRRPDGTLANVVHRDVSLSNVLLDTAAQVKLHDFGIARMEESGELPTAVGVFKGKLGLAAPELLRGEKATPQSDLYATGVVMYQLLSGQNPFRGETEAATMFRVMEHVPAPLSTLRDDLPIGLDEVLSRALDKDPKARFESAALFAEGLAALCKRSDEAVQRDLARQLRNDFAIMPAYLGLESLTDRDGAWREAQSLPMSSQVPLISSALSSTAVALRSRAHAQTLPRGEALPRPQGQEPVSAELFASSLLRRVAAQPRSLALAFALGGAVVALAVLLLTGQRHSPAPPPARSLARETPPAALAAAPAAVAPPAPVSSAAKGTPPLEKATTEARPKAKRAPAPAQPDAATLSRKFRAKQPQIESCFRQQTEQVVGMPRVSVRFEVDRTGKVTRASLSPAALSATPLGRCLLQTAEAARFGQLTEPVAFSIPITAQRGTKPN
ncbi:MAG: protein kinase [Deltaproteobacteria bacterium]